MRKRDGDVTYVGGDAVVGENPPAVIANSDMSLISPYMAIAIIRNPESTFFEFLVFDVFGSGHF